MARLAVIAIGLLALMSATAVFAQDGNNGPYFNTSFELLLDVGGARFTNGNSSSGAMYLLTGVMLPWNFVAGNESGLLAGGQLSQGAVQNMMGIAEVECVLLDPSIVISSMNVSVSSCRRTYYFINNTNGTLTPNATTVSLRDPKFLVSVATMASMSNASAIVISGGLDIGHVNGMNASAVPASTNITWFRPILGAAGLLNSLTGQEFIAIPSTFISSTGDSLLNWVNMTNSTTSSNSSGSSSGNSGGSPWIF